MATIRNIYFQDEVEQKLKGEANISGLINSLLREHFKNANIKEMTYEQKQIRIKELEIKIEAMKKLEEIGVKNVSI